MIKRIYVSRKCKLNIIVAHNLLNILSKHNCFGKDRIDLIKAMRKQASIEPIRLPCDKTIQKILKVLDGLISGEIQYEDPRNSFWIRTVEPIFIAMGLISPEEGICFSDEPGLVIYRKSESQLTSTNISNSIIYCFSSDDLIEKMFNCIPKPKTIVVSLPFVIDHFIEIFKDGSFASCNIYILFNELRRDPILRLANLNLIHNVRDYIDEQEHIKKRLRYFSRETHRRCYVSYSTDCGIVYQPLLFAISNNQKIFCATPTVLRNAFISDEIYYWIDRKIPPSIGDAIEHIKEYIEG